MKLLDAMRLMDEVQLMAIEGNEIHVPVRLVDIKQSYGSIRFLIRPVGGSGAKWVDAARILTGKE